MIFICMHSSRNTEFDVEKNSKFVFSTSFYIRIPSEIEMNKKKLNFHFTRMIFLFTNSDFYFTSSPVFFSHFFNCKSYQYNTSYFFFLSSISTASNVFSSMLYYLCSLKEIWVNRLHLKYNVNWWISQIFLCVKFSNWLFILSVHFCFFFFHYLNLKIWCDKWHENYYL